MSLKLSDRYAKAVTSSDLRLVARQECDADVLVATGIADMHSGPHRDGGLALTLQRLRIEFDRIDRRSLMASGTGHTDAHLPSLPAARTSLHAFMIGKVKRESWPVEEARLPSLAVKILDHLLDPICPSCRGRCFEVLNCRLTNNECRRCQGSGRRLPRVGSRSELELFISTQEDITRKLQRLSRRAGAYLSG